MQYQVITVQAGGPIGTDFDACAVALARRVEAAIREGWEPLGGVQVGHPLGGAQPSLLQAMVRRS